MRASVEAILSPFSTRQVQVEQAANARFNRFLRGRYQWAFSGIDWRYGGKIERVACNHASAELLGELYQKYPKAFSDGLSVYFDLGPCEVVISASAKTLFEDMGRIEHWDDHYVTDYLVFDESTGTVIELYHEGYYTVGRPQDLTQTLEKPKGLDDFIEFVKNNQDKIGSSEP